MSRVLLVHGFSGSSTHVHDLGEFLTKAGHRVELAVLPGHDLSPEELAKTTARDWYRAVKKRFLRLAPQESTFSVGYSFGGNLLLKLATETDLAGIVTINTPKRLQQQNWRQYLLPLIKPFNLYYQKPQSGKDASEQIPPRFMPSYERIPYNALDSMFTFLRREMTPAQLGRVKVPALIIQSINDPTVDRESGRFFLDSINTKDKHLEQVDSDRHNILYKEDFQFVIDQIKSWIEYRDK